jgi:hypothetical protein
LFVFANFAVCILGKGKLGLKGVDFEPRYSKYRAKFQTITARFKTLREAANYYLKCNKSLQLLTTKLKEGYERDTLNVITVN